jgi:hypothetical protein
MLSIWCRRVNGYPQADGNGGRTRNNTSEVPSRCGPVGELAIASTGSADAVRRGDAQRFLRWNSLTR